MTPGPVNLTLDQTLGTSGEPHDWYLAYINDNGQWIWIKQQGTSTVPTRFMESIPLSLQGYDLLNLYLFPGSSATFAFIIIDPLGHTIHDFITSVVPG